MEFWHCALGDVPAVVMGGLNGFIVNPGDYEKFAERIKEIFSLSEEKIKFIKGRARRVVTDDFDSRKLLKKMVDSSACEGV